MLEEDPEIAYLRYSMKYNQTDKALSYLSMAKTTNMEAQEIYLDILNKKKKNIDSRYIKAIYAMFSQNKSCELCFEKQSDSLMIDIDEKLLIRYYSRIIQLGIKKVSYFWNNFSKLKFLLPAIVLLLQQINAIVSNIDKITNLEYHMKVLRLIFAENSMIEERIYHLLIEQGYLASMDQFYRINGIDLVSDQQYERRSDIIQEDDQQSQEQALELGQNKPIASTVTLTSKKKIRSVKKINGRQFKPVSSNQDTEKMKIKTMFESIIKVLKFVTSGQVKEKPIKKQSRRYSPANLTSDRSPRESTKNQQQKQKHNKMTKKISRDFNQIQKQVVKTEERKIAKKLSIQVMTLFSHQFRSLIDNLEPFEIQSFSELLVKSEPNQNKNNGPFGINNSGKQGHIHSTQSLNLLRYQSKRAKTIDRIVKSKYEKQFNSDIQTNINDFERFPRMIKGTKFSFKSAPGAYLCLNNMHQRKTLQYGEKGNKYKNLNKILLQQNNQSLQLFDNQLITTDLLLQHKTSLNNNDHKKSIKIANNQLGLGIGVNLGFIKQKMQLSKDRNNQSFLNSDMRKQSQRKYTKLPQKQITCMKKKNSQGIKLKKISSTRNKSQKENRFNYTCATQVIEPQNMYRISKIRTQTVNFNHNKKHQIYTVYDRFRRKMVG